MPQSQGNQPGDGGQVGNTGLQVLISVESG
jgi:hypothetical protein